MRHELLHIDHAVLHQPDRARPRVAVPVLVLQVDLERAQSHKRNRHLVLANANHKDLPAELDAPDCRRDAAFDSGAFDDKGGTEEGVTGRGWVGVVVERVDDAICILLGGGAAPDLVSAHVGDEGLCEVETAGVDVCDGNGCCAGCARAEETDETDGACSSDHDGVSKAHSAAFDCRKGYAERFQHGTILIAHVPDLVAPDGRVVDVAAEQAVDGRRGEERNLFTSIVSAREAGFASVADDIGFDGDAVAGFEVRYARVGCDHSASRFVTENVIPLDDHRADAASVPEVDIGAGSLAVTLVTRLDAG